MKKIVFLVLTFLMFCGASLTVNGQAKVRVGFFEFEGFNEFEDGCLSGYGYEYLMEISKYTGWEYEFVTSTETAEGTVPLTYEKCLQMLENNEIDILGSVRKTTEREENFYFPLFSSGMNFGVLTTRVGENTYTTSDFNTLDNVKIGLIKGSSRNAEIIEYFSSNGVDDYTVYEYGTNDELVTALLNTKTVDVAYTSNLRRMTGERTIARINPGAYYFVTNKTNSLYGEALNKAMEEIEVNDPNFAKDLQNKYYTDASKTNLVLTAEEIDYVKNQEPLRIGVFANSQPVSYFEEGTKAKGIVVDIFDIISEETGLKFTYIPISDKIEAGEYIKNDEVDIIAGFPNDYEWGISNEVKITTSFLKVPLSIIVNSNASDFLSPECKVASIRNNYIFESITQNLGYTSYKYYDSFRECMAAVNNGEADVTYIPTYVADYMLSTPSFTKIDIRSNGLNGFEMAAAVSPESNDTLYLLFNRAINGITEEKIEEVIYSNILFNVEDDGLSGLLYKYPVVFFIIVLVICLILVGTLAIYMIFRWKIKNNMQLNDERIGVALSRTDIALWDYDVKRRSIVQSKASKKVFGYSDKIISVPESLVESGFVHPEDAGEFCQTFYLILSDSKTSMGTFRVKKIDVDEYVWLRITLTNVYDKKGRSIRAIGVSEDVTDEIINQREYFKAHRYQIANTDDSIFSYEIDLTGGKVLSQKGKTAIGIEDAKRDDYRYVIEKSRRTRIHIDDQEEYSSFLDGEGLLASFAEGITEKSREFRVVNPVNRKDYIWALYEVYMFNDPLIRHTCASIYVKDITATKDAQLNLVERATQDPLTKLLNREVFKEKVETYLKDATNSSKMCAMVIIDIDDLKIINDLYGHDSGDRAIIALASILAKNIADVGWAARLGGDEFTAFIKDVDSLMSLQNYANELCQSLAVPIEDVVVTCSLGMAYVKVSKATYAKMYKISDDAMYEVKQKGKHYAIINKD